MLAFWREARPAGAIPAFGGGKAGMAAMLLAGVRMFGSVPRRSRPQWSVVRPRILVFEFRISKLKIQFLNLEFQVPCPDMRVSRIQAHARERGIPLRPGLQSCWSLSVWLALACGACSVAFCSLWPQAHSAEAGDLLVWRNGRFGPGPSGREEREEEVADDLARRDSAVAASA